VERKLPGNNSDAPENGGGRKPVVSVIVPCYNCRQFVSEAIESALAQSYANVEIVVVDDGSTDGSPEIVQSYPVLLLQQSHQGVSAARNLGIRASHGEYLVFLDSDDRLLPDGVAAGVADLEQNPQCAMAVGPHLLISQSGDWIAMRSKPCHLRDGYELLLRSNFIECTSSVLFRRSCISEHCGFRPSLTGAEDYDLYLRVARDSLICCHSQAVAEYRLHASSASHKSTMMLAHTLAVISEQWPFARKSLRRMAAYFYGCLFWRRKYGRQLTVEMAMSELGLPPQEARIAWRLLARSYPQGLLVVLISKVLPKNLVRFMLLRA
jgi:glycosyltransferase involved in cell wall biosynthesis